MSKRTVNYQYYVEGDDEKALLCTLKRDYPCIESGKVDKFNVVQNKFTIARIRPLKQNTVVILVYDTDVEKIDILQQNIAFLNKQSAIKEVICIPQVSSLEDELLYACNMKCIKELTCSSSKADYKKDLIACTNLNARLTKCGFDISRFWSRVPANIFQPFGNQGNKIKL